MTSEPEPDPCEPDPLELSSTEVARSFARATSASLQKTRARFSRFPTVQLLCRLVCLEHLAAQEAFLRRSEYLGGVDHLITRTKGGKSQ